jgi:hypothetical protein
MSIDEIEKIIQENNPKTAALLITSMYIKSLGKHLVNVSLESWLGAGGTEQGWEAWSAKRNKLNF